MQSPVRGQRIQAVLLLAVAVVYLMGTRSLPAGRGEPGPALFPTVLGVLLALLALRLFWGGRGKAQEAGGEKAGKPQHRPLAYPMAGVVLAGGFAVLFPLLGFWIPTWLLSLGLTALFLGDDNGASGLARLVQLVVVPTCATLLVYLLFVAGLGIALPTPFWVE